MKNSKVLKTLARHFSLMFMVMLVPGVLKAATIVVTSGADSGVNTLRSAITAAAAGDTIDFNLGSDQVITLASTLPTINKNLTIQNTSGFNVTVSGNFAVRVFLITAGTVNIRDINIAAGRTTTASTHGAGLLVQNGATTLNLTNTSFFSNVTAGGADGGALQNEGATVNILNSTFSNNAASGFGGAIDNASGTINISFTTIVGNTSNVDTSSAANGGGVFNASGGTLRIKNSILSNNNALVSSGPECASGTPNAITSLGGNIIFNPAGCGNLNIPGGAKPDITFVSPVIGPLQDNGGLTLTHALLAGSPAIDTADCVVPGGQSAFFACPATDQIATSRPQGGGFDRGSFEFKLAGAAGQVDLQVDNRVSNSTPSVGNTISYTVSVLNKGPNPAANLRMTAFFDPGLTINSVTPISGIGGTPPTCSISNSVVICTNGTLGVNVAPLTPPYSAQYVINATVNAGGPISAHASVIDLTNQDSDPTNNNDTAEINAAGAAGPSADLSITKSIDKPLSSIGDTVVFTMAVKNNGTSNATGVSVRDFISGPFSFVSTTASGGCSTLSNTNGLELLCNVGTINNGATTTFTITGTVGTGGQEGQVDNTATVYAGANASDPNLENNIAIASTVVQAAASTQIDLGIVKYVNEPLSTTGDNLEFFIGVINNSLTDTAQNVVVRDVISGPYALDVVSNDFPGDCSVNTIGTGAIELICSVGSLPANSGYQFFHIFGLAGPNQFSVGQVDNIATIYDPADSSIPYAGSEDPNPSNNSAVASSVVQAPGSRVADLDVTKTVDKPQSQGGDTVTFTIVVQNNGPDDAFGVKVRDFASGPFTYVSDTAPGLGGCSPTAATNGTELICNIGEVDSGNNVTFTIVGTVGPGGGQVDNTATVYDTTVVLNDAFVRATFDPVTANNVAVASTVVTVPICGDGLQEGSEQCDDGINNGLPGDPCDATCHLVPICGDGILEGTEQCDDGNTTSGDGCSATCRIEGVDLSIVKTVDQATAVTGTTVHYTLTVKNNELIGGRSASNVVVNDLHSGPLSNYQNLTTTAGSCDPAGNPIHCTIGAMAPQAVVTIEYDGDIGLGQIDNIASVDDTDNPVGPVPQTQDPNTTNNSAVASTVGFNAGAPSVDLSVVKSVNVGQAVVGTTDAVTFTITVNNPDTTNAPTVHLTDTFGMEAGAFTMTGSPTFTTGGGSCGGVLPSLTCDINSFTGGQAVIEITGTLNLLGQVDNHVSVADTTGNSQDPNFTNNSSTASVIGVNAGAPNVDLSVVKSVNVGQATVGVTDAVTFTVTVNNPDPSAAPTVHVTDNFGMAPSAFTMTGSPTFTTGGGSCSGSLPTLTCDINSFSGGQATFTITGTINSPGQIDNHVAVADTTGGTHDPDFTNNATVASVIGISPAAPSVNLSVTKSVNVGQAIIGTTDAVTFTITVNNPDTTNVPTVHLTDSFGMVAGAFTMTGSPTFTTGGGSCSGSLPTLTCDIDTFATGKAVITITGTINTLGQIDNHVSVADTTGATQDPDFTNNSAVASVIGVSPAAPSVDLSVTKSVNVGQAIIGTTDAVTFTITVNNPDTTNVPSVHLTDNFGMAAGAFTMTGSPSFTLGGGSCSGSLPTLTCDIDTFSTGQAKITITGTINSVGQIDNHVSVADTTGGSQDPNFTNNSATASVIGVNPAVPTTDLSLTKVVDLAHANINDTVTFTVTVTNNDSTNTADGVRITDIAVGPMDVQTMAFTSGTGTCTPSAVLPASAQPFISFVCIPTGGTMAAGATVEITMTAKVTGEGQIDNTASADVTVTRDPDHSNNTATASVNGTSSADLKVTKTLLNGPNFNIGDTANFEITIENLGPNDATNVTLTDMQLGGLSFDTPAPTGCTINGNNMTCDVTPLLASGNSITLDYSSTADLNGAWSNIVTVSSDVEDRIMSNNTTSVNVNVGVAANTANLAVTKTADVTEVKEGSDIHYTVVVTNNGPDDAANVVLNDFIAGPFDSVSNIQITPAGTCSELNGLITCTVPSLPSALGFNTVTITYTVTSSAPGSLSNLAVVSGSVLDPDQSDNSAAYQVQVFDALADLSITKSVNPNPGLAAGEFTYNVLVKNAGPDTAKHAIVVDQLAGKFSGVTATPSSGSCTTQSDQPDTTTVICDLGDIAKNAQATITIKVTGSGPASVLSNLAAVYSDTHDPLLGNNVATADTIQAGENPPGPTPTPTATPTVILEGHGAFAKVGGCSLEEGATSPVPWAALMVLALATLRVVVAQRRAR